MPETSEQTLQRANSSMARLPTPLDPYDVREAARRSVVSSPGYPYRRRQSMNPGGHELCGLQLQGQASAAAGEVVKEGLEDRAAPQPRHSVQRPKPTKSPPRRRPDAFESDASFEHPRRTKRSTAPDRHHPKPPPRSKRPPQQISLSKKHTIINMPPSSPPLPRQPPTPLDLESQQPLTRLNRLRALAHRVANYIDDDTNELFEPKPKPRVGGPRRRWWKPSKKVIWVLVGTAVLTVGCSAVLFPEAFTGKGGSGL